MWLDSQKIWLLIQETIQENEIPNISYAIFIARSVIGF